MRGRPVCPFGGLETDEFGSTAKKRLIILVKEPFIFYHIADVYGKIVGHSLFKISFWEPGNGTTK